MVVEPRPRGVLLALIGVWAAIVALVGPYFSFGFDTTQHVATSRSGTGRSASALESPSSWPAS